MAHLLMIAPAPVIDRGDQLALDVKFVEGMRLHQAYWPSRITCLLRRGAGAIPFGRDYPRDALPFDLSLLDPEEPLTDRHLSGADLIYAGADDFRCLDLHRQLRPGQKLVHAIEYTQETRLQILNLDRSRSTLSRLKGRVWLMQQERKRRRAFRAADGLHSNGYPAHDLYGPLNRDALFYLDGRMTDDLFATADEMDARAAHLAGGGPLRLVYSGRLETLKGAQDLVPVARRLIDRGVRFTLDIARLPDPAQVRMHGAVDFETALVPFTRTNADLFLGCHRQSDPSCTYVEAMGCGVAVASYENRMWAGLNGQAQAGWGAPLGDVQGLADRIADVADDRAAVTRACRNAWDFSKAHGFQPEFQRRMQHLAHIAGVTLRTVAA
jgi:colanic acid/amylovoran biosynthesis glycosyltransferase